MADSVETDWYLREWMAHFKKRQVALVRELGWDKAKANNYWHGRQPYRREIVAEIAGWLGIRPHELLMPPDEALALRRLRKSAEEIVAGAVASESPIAPPSLKPRRTGT